MPEDASLLPPEDAPLPQSEQCDPAALTAIARHVQNFAPSTIVDLSSRGLSYPDQLSCFTTAIDTETAAAIIHLDLSHNFLAALPGAAMVKPLRSLEELDLSHNKFGAFPSELCALPALTALDVSSNCLESLEVSAELFSTGLPSLETLLLSDNRLTAIPGCIARCAKLNALDLARNRLSLGISEATPTAPTTRCEDWAASPS